MVAVGMARARRRMEPDLPERARNSLKINAKIDVWQQKRGGCGGVDWLLWVVRSAAGCAGCLGAGLFPPGGPSKVLLSGLGQKERLVCVFS